MMTNLIISTTMQWWWWRLWKMVWQGSKEIDIAATLEHIRDQRSGGMIMMLTITIIMIITMIFKAMYFPQITMFKGWMTSIWNCRNGADPVPVWVLSDGSGGRDPRNPQGAASVEQLGQVEAGHEEHDGQVETGQGQGDQGAAWDRLAGCSPWNRGRLVGWCQGKIASAWSKLWPRY